MLPDPTLDDVPFDRARLITADQHLFSSFTARETLALADALRAGTLAADAPLVLATVGCQTVAVLLDQLAFHHVIQGELDGQRWAMTFCIVCHTGNAWDPTVGGAPLSLSVGGVYNGMVMLKDAQGDLWDHITGRCVSGTRQGTRLAHLSPLVHTTAAAAHKRSPEARLVLTRRGFWARLMSALVMGVFAYIAPPHFGLTMSGPADPRLPQRTLGLGVWSGGTARFYPLDRLRERGPLRDTLPGGPVRIHIDTEGGFPEARWADDPGHPMQTFTRWYGFSRTFPGAEIGG